MNLNHDDVPGYMIYRSDWEALNEINDPKIKLEIYEKLSEFSFTGKWNLDGLEQVSKMYLIGRKPTLEASISNFLNGKKGGRPPKKETKKRGVSKNKKGGLSENEKGGSQKPETYMYMDKDMEMEKEMEKDKEKDMCVSSRPTPSTHTPIDLSKKEYAPNVFLTESEMVSLKNEYGANKINLYLQILSEGKDLHGYEYKSDYLAIKKWIYNDEG